MESIGPVHCKGHFVRNGTTVKLNGAMKAFYRSLDAAAECMFSYEFKEGTSTSTSHLFPPSGVYVGKTFSYSGEIVEDEMSLSFEQILDGFYSVTGKGSHHEVEYRVYGTFDIEKNELKIIRKRRLHINAPVRSKADDQPSSISHAVPSNKRRKSKMVSDEFVENSSGNDNSSGKGPLCPSVRLRGHYLDHGVSAIFDELAEKSDDDSLHGNEADLSASRAAEQASKRRKKDSRKKDSDQPSFISHVVPSNKRKKQIPFEQRLEDLREFERIKGHTNVPESYDPSLGNWVTRIRAQYKAVKKGKTNALTPDRIAKLEALGFQWIVQETFEQRIEALREFKVIYGNVDVPRDYAEDPSLAFWVSNCRQRKASLSESRVAKLEALGFQWSIYKTFEQRLGDLMKFKGIHGHVNVRKGLTCQDPSLANWVNHLRTEYKDVQKGKTNALTLDRITTLESLGFQWSVREAQWDYWFGELVEYMAANGGSSNVTAVDEHTIHLKRWTTTQRELYHLVNDDNDRLLDEKREARLDGIGFVFYHEKRKVSQKSSRIEWKILHEMLPVIEDFGHEWFSLDKEYGGTRYRPDAVMHKGSTILTDGFVIFVEIDEGAHDPKKPSYTPEKEQTRMKALSDEAFKDEGVESVYFIRVNTGRLTEVLPKQVETVRQVLADIHTKKSKGYHVYYVDYKDNHVHVQESEKKEINNFVSVNKFHTENFNEKATKITVEDL